MYVILTSRFGKSGVRSEICYNVNTRPSLSVLGLLFRAHTLTFIYSEYRFSN